MRGLERLSVSQVSSEFRCDMKASMKRGRDGGREREGGGGGGIDRVKQTDRQSGRKRVISANTR